MDAKGREREVCTQTIPLPDWIKSEADAVTWADMFIDLPEGTEFHEITEIPISLADEDIPRL